MFIFHSRVMTPEILVCPVNFVSTDFLAGGFKLIEKYDFVNHPNAAYFTTRCPKIIQRYSQIFTLSKDVLSNGQIKTSGLAFLCSRNLENCSNFRSPMKLIIPVSIVFTKQKRISLKSLFWYNSIVSMVLWYILIPLDNSLRCLRHGPCCWVADFLHLRLQVGWQLKDKNKTVACRAFLLRPFFLVACTRAERVWDFTAPH